MIEGVEGNARMETAGKAVAEVCERVSQVHRANKATYVFAAYSPSRFSCASSCRSSLKGSL